MSTYDHEVFLEAVAYMEQRPETALQVADIAAGIHVSESRLQRSFRACAHSGVHAYVLRQRLERAKALLICGACVEEAALACGFCNRNHFSCCFKKHFKVTPSQIKKQHP